MARLLHFDVDEPVCELALAPLALSALSVGSDVHTLAMLSAVKPLANILATVRPLEDSVTLLDIRVVVATVLAIIWPFEATISVLFSLGETTMVDATVCVF